MDYPPDATFYVRLSLVRRFTRSLAEKVKEQV